MRRLAPKNQFFYFAVIEQECRRNNITINPFPMEDGYGRANYEAKMIRIPKIKSKEAVLISFHEIGHLLYGRVKPNFVNEYLAEKFAIEKGKELGCYSEAYIKNAKLYVLHKMDEAYKRGLKLENIPEEVICFLGEEYIKWKKDL